MFNIKDYGAKEGALCTVEIQKAIDAAADACGTVVIPAGIFITSTLNLKGASLYLEKGAVLKGSGDINDYPYYGYDHNEMGKTLSFLYCMDCENIDIYGEGTIDLNGSAFYDFSKPVLPNSSEPLTEEQKKECTVSYEKRVNQPMLFLRCRHINIHGIKILDAPCWTMTFIECQDIKLSDLTIDNNLNIPNNDGMHFCACKDVIVHNCNISSGDDCIAISSITNWNLPSERFTISNCILRSCSKAIVLGYMHSIVRDVTISNCVIYESNRAFAIMASTGTGLVENVTVSNMRLDTRIRAGCWWGNGEPVALMGVWHHYENYRDPPPERKFAVCIKNIIFSNLVCTGENVIAVIGENKSVKDIIFDNIVFELKESKNLSLKGRMIDLDPSTVKAALPDENEPYWLFVRDADNVQVKNYIAKPFNGKIPKELNHNHHNMIQSSKG